jgi:hypothetical protein
MGEGRNTVNCPYRKKAINWEIVIEAIKKALCAIPGSGCLGDR